MDDYNTRRVMFFVAIIVFSSILLSVILWNWWVRTDQGATEVAPFGQQEWEIQAEPDSQLVRRAAAYLVLVMTPDGYTGTGYFMPDPRNLWDWYVVTNKHVVEDNGQVTVYWPETGEAIQVEVLGTDRQADIALINVQPQDFRVAQYTDGLEFLKDNGRGIFTSTERPEPGTPVFAFGFPESAQGEPRMTKGIVQQRDIYYNCGGEPSVNWLSIGQETGRPGFSGGPVFNYEGAIIAMNTCGFPEEYKGLATPMSEIQDKFNPLVRGHHLPTTGQRGPNR